MAEYRRGAHTVCGVKHHVVWITTYRCRVLCGELAVRTRDLIREICMAKEIWASTATLTSCANARPSGNR